MNKHFEIIFEYCHVVAVNGDNAILFYEDGDPFLTAEINGASFSCESEEEFHEMVKQFGDDTFEE